MNCKYLTWKQAEKDYAALNRGLPALIVNIDTGQVGTNAATNGGKFGSAPVEYLEGSSEKI